MAQSSPIPTSTPRQRTVLRAMRGLRTVDGGGVSLTRIIGTPALPQVDPFLMLDAFGSDQPEAYIAGFPDHPHRGFETITYMLAGRMRHWDNKGHSGLLGPGDVQWMTAGRGLVHSEMPEQQEGLLQGFQFWLNLPAARKMVEPAYQDIPAAEIPVVKVGPTEITVIAGQVAEASGPVAPADTRPLILDIRFLEAGSLDLPIPAGHNGFVYIQNGAVLAGDTSLTPGMIGVLGDGDAVRIEAQAQGRVLLAAARPLNEPVVRHGPFVMNSREEILQAFEDYHANRF